MELMRGLLPLCLLAILPLYNAEPQVSVSIPSLLRSGDTAKACLTVKRHANPMDVQITLYAVDTNYTLVNEQFPPGDIFKTFEIQVPVVTDATPAFLVVSAVSGTYNYTARQAVVIASSGNVAFIRTDKETYKGGQEVQIAVLSIDNKMRPVDEMFPAIYIMDPAGNRVYQWLNRSTKGAFLFLRSTVLADPDLGLYNIVAERQSGGSVSKSFKVDQYILPKFSITLKTPSMVTILDKNVSVEINARYTYDQGVPGKISGRLCRPPANYYSGNTCNRNPDGICVPFTGETDFEGTFKGHVELSLFQLDRSGYLMTLNAQATLTEQGTNVQVTESKSISITSQLGRAYFDPKSTPSYFKVGIPLPGAIIVENGLGEPASGQLVLLQVDGKPLQNLTSDETGRAEFEIDTSEFTNSGVNLQLVYKNQEQCYDSNWIVPSYSNDNRYVTRFFSRTNSYVQLQGPKEELQCGKKYNIKVQYSFGKEALAGDGTTIKFVYIAMSRAEIVGSGEHSVDVSQSRQGEFNLTYEASPDHAPIVQYLVQYMLKDELVGDAINMNLENCFKNPVSANFSSESGTPGSDVSLDVTATPQSSCLMRIFDLSVLLLDPGTTFSPSTVYNSLQYNQLSGYNVAGLDVEPPQPSCIDVNKQILVDGIYWQPVNFPEEEDVRKVFRDIGILVITNTPFQQPELCSQPVPFRPQPFFARPSGGFVNSIETSSFIAEAAPPPVADGGAGAPEIASMRRYFPEMWAFGPVSVGESGSTLVPLHVPDTITKWQSDLLCLSNDTGMGMTKRPANFTSFQKLFVDLSLPDSIVHGETMRLVANVANYMDKCAKVKVSFDPSNDYVAEPRDADPVKCVCSKERASYSWNINATSMGVSNVTITAETLNIGESCEGPADPNEPKRKDTIVRSFTVEPEGIRTEVTKTDLVCVKGENSVTQVNINPSGRIVSGSLTATVQVIGDLVGRALSNPEALIVQPTGCGEQNLATLMPIARVVEFLTLTGRLTKEIEQRAVQNMGVGAMRQMRYRNADGSFSTFPHGKPSSWLTLLTMQTFQAIKPYTFVDDNNFKQSLIYFETLQDLSTGQFKPKGNLFNSALKGGADGDVSFTCGVVSYLLGGAYGASPALLRQAVSFLDAASRKEQSSFNLAMLFKTFRMLGNVERADAIKEQLMSKAIDEGGMLYWQREFRPKQQTPYLFSAQAPSSEIELTATVLQAMAYGENSTTVSEDNLNIMTKISTFLVRQQNIHGSYSTTSDTVAALDALCDYAALVFQKDAANTVQLKFGGQLIREFTVDQPSRILLQSEALPQVPGNYSVEVSGNGCVLVQTGVVAYVPFQPEDSAFRLSMTTFPEDCKNGVAYNVNIQVNASYSGIQNKSNMALIDMPLLSGYNMEANSLLKLQSDFPKAEVKNNHLIVYLNDMTSKVVTFKVTQEMGSRVDNFQQRTGKIYDYYESEENGACALYHPCTLKTA